MILSLFCHDCAADTATESKFHPGISFARLSSAPASSTAEMPVFTISSSPFLRSNPRTQAMFIPSTDPPSAFLPDFIKMTLVGLAEKNDEKYRYCSSAHPDEMRFPDRELPSHSRLQSTGLSQFTAKPRSTSTPIMPSAAAVYLCMPHRGVAVSS